MTEGTAQVANIDLSKGDETIAAGASEELAGDVIDFFDELERQVNGEVAEEVQTAPQTATRQTAADPNAAKVETNSATAVEDRLSTLEKRYGDSSREARRLYKRLQELEPYAPILDSMRSDEGLVTHVRNYFDGDGSAQVRNKLNLPEDFVFVGDDAFRDPNSESAKVLNSTIDSIVEQRISQANQVQRQDIQRLTEEQNFKAKHKYSDEEWADLQEFAKNNRLTIEDIHYLKNREKREENIVNSARDEARVQREKIQSTPTSAASTGSAPVQEKSTEDRIFDTLKGLDDGMLGVFDQ